MTVIALCACGTGRSESAAAPTSTVTVAPSPPAASAADLIAIAKQIYPYSSQYGYYTVCGVNGDLSGCPVTERLKAYLTQKQITLCGCQNPAPSMDVTATTAAGGGVAHVVLGYQPTPVRFDLIIVRIAGALLVDDQECTGGGPSTSIYVRTGNC